jgi:hypothetical protein
LTPPVNGAPPTWVPATAHSPSASTSRFRSTNIYDLFAKVTRRDYDGSCSHDDELSILEYAQAFEQAARA